MQRALGRIAKPDDRDKLYSLAPRKASQRISRTWRNYGWIGDQGSQPHCVGFAWSAWLNSAPIKQFANPSGIYRFAQFVDDIAGENYAGTTVRGGAKLLMELGFISEFRWTWNVNLLLDMVLDVGPVVVGTDWLDGMWEPDEKNYLRVTGDVIGGHAYLVSGADKRRGRFTITNSWGKDWGDGGQAYMLIDDMAKLLKANGECCLGIEHKPHT